MSNLIDPEPKRQALLREHEGSSAIVPAANYNPGSFGCHELLDRTALVVDILERHVVQHPTCVQKAEWFALAREASTILNRLYKEIGCEHLSNADA